MSTPSRRQFLMALGAVVVTGTAARSGYAQRAGARVNRVLTAFRARLLRAGLNASERGQLTSVDMSNTAQGDTHTLALLACDNAARVLLPIALEAAERGEDASGLRALSPISTDANAAAVADRLQRLSAVLLEANTCQGRGAACASDPHVALGAMARDVAAACLGASDHSLADDRVAERVAVAIDSGLHFAPSRTAMVTGVASLLLAMTAIAH